MMMEPEERKEVRKSRHDAKSDYAREEMVPRENIIFSPLDVFTLICGSFFYADGRIFWFSRKKFFGSYLFFNATRRIYFFSP